VCVVACAEAWRGDGEIVASPFGTIPVIGARVARATFAPDLVLSDGEAIAVASLLPLDGTGDRVVEGWLPFRNFFDVAWSGRRHVMMAASQLDREGNQNIAAIGPWERPRAQLIGVRGAPGNTVNHTTSYWVPNHSPRVFVEHVDFVCGVGYDRAAAAGSRVASYHEIRRVVSDLGVFDFETPDHAMRLRSLHPGVNVDDVVEATGFALVVPEDLGQSRLPTEAELETINAIDPGGLRYSEVAG